MSITTIIITCAFVIVVVIVIVIVDVVAIIVAIVATEQTELPHEPDTVFLRAHKHRYMQLQFPSATILDM